MNETFPHSNDEDQQKIDEDATDQAVESWEKNHKSRAQAELRSAIELTIAM